MKHIIIAISIVFLSTLSVIAQEEPQTLSGMEKKPISRFGLSVGIDEGLPIGKVHDFASFVIGASVEGEYKVLKELGITLNAGYIYFVGKDNGTGISFVPAMAGLKFYLNRRIYLAGQLGASMYVGPDSSDEAYLSYTQGIGYQASNRINLLAKYQGVNVSGETSYSFLGLRIAYNIGKNYRK